METSSDKVSMAVRVHIKSGVISRIENLMTYTIRSKYVNVGQFSTKITFG